MTCSGCNKSKPIQNKKYNLCGDCVFEKNNGGKSKQEVYATRAALKPQKTYVFKKSKPIKKQTEKEKHVKDHLSQLKKNIRQEAIDSDMYYCWGTGNSSTQLDCSHILSVGQFKHLELDKDNINLFSRQAHLNWESGNIVKMSTLLTFEKDLFYIKSHSIETFNKIIFKIKSEIQRDPTSSVAKKLVNILKIFGKFVA
jgi:hypothetical protein